MDSLLPAQKTDAEADKRVLYTGRRTTKIDAEATQQRDITQDDVEGAGWNGALSDRNEKYLEVSSNEIASFTISSDILYAYRYEKAELRHPKITTCYAQAFRHPDDGSQTD